MAQNKFEKSLAEGAHKQLLSLVGKWKGLTKTWFEPDVLADESISSANIQSILAGRFISIDYEGEIQGADLTGKMIVGYDIPYQKYCISWIDSFHMGSQIMLSAGSETENGFSVLGSYGSPEYEADWGWKTQVEFVNANEFILTAYNISPDGIESKATETTYKRFL